MRLGFSTQEAYFTILGVLIVLSAIGTIIGNWLVSRAQGNETRLNNLCSARIYCADSDQAP